MKIKTSRRCLLQILAGAAISSQCTFASSSTSSPGKSLLQIGLVTDAQYADSPAKGSRFYRQSIEKLGTAVEHFNQYPLDFCIHLGDLIDHTWSSFDEISQPLKGCRHQLHHLPGNHDFDVLDEFKLRVPERLGMTARYSAFDMKGFRFILLDTNDHSTYAWPAGSAEVADAAKELERLKSASVKQAQSWNGGLRSAQLDWFEQNCREAMTSKKKVVVFAHHPVFPDDIHNLWNADRVLAIIERYPSVVAWVNGHNHAGNFGMHSGVPFITLHGMVETADTNAFATASLHGDRIVITGHGREPSREILFRT